MKFTAILLLVACLQVSGTGHSQITLSEKNVPLQKVFKQIQQQTGYDFLYSVELLQQSGKVSIDVYNVSIEEALKQCLKDKPLAYSIIERTIIIKPKEETPPPVIIEVAPPPIEIKGRIMDESGIPIPGVTIRVKGTGSGTSTNENGEFSLSGVDPNAVLQISGTNIETFEMKVEGRTNLPTIIAKTKVIAGSEIVVSVNTGYQSLSKERSAGSFSKPDIDILQNRSTTMNVLQRLDGLVAGLTVNNAPGSSQNPFLIRGLSTIGIPDPFNSANSTGTNRNPLYVVDGIAIDDVSFLNPQDIDDITVLKDATATSIWGARASNGVIVIVTKKGKFSGKLKVQYDGFVNFQGKPDLNYIQVLNSQQFIQAAKDIFDPVFNPWNTTSTYSNYASTGVAPHEMILYNQYRGLISPSQANTSLDSLASINNVQQIKDLWYRKSVLTNHTISVSGGSAFHSFYGSLAYTGTHSTRPGDENKLYKVNLRQDFNFNKSIQAYVLTELTNTVTAAKRAVGVDNRFYPYQLFKDQGGNNLSMPYMGYLSDSIRLDYQSKSRINLDYNPLDEYEYGYTKSDALLNRIVAGLTAKLYKGLRFEGVYGYIKGSNKTTSYDDTKSYLVRSELTQFTVAATPAATPVYYLPTNGGIYEVTNLSQRNWTIRNQLIYDNAWKNNLHQLTLLAGQEAQEQFTNATRTTVRGYNELLQTYGRVDYATLATTGVASPVMPNNIGRSILGIDGYDALFSKGETETRFTSYYANAAYTYKKKYSINASWRIDQSNLFGIDKSAQNRPVWSLGGKWMLSDEKFMKNISWINRFAVRATYGITGNSPVPGTASSFDILTAQSSNFLPGGVGLRIANPANRKLTWESTKTLNFGFDFTVFKNILSGSLDLYHKKTSNLLGNLAVNSFTGFSAITGNFGNMQNKGVELSLNSRNITKKNFAWSTLFTMAYNKNTVTRLNTVAPITTGAQKVAQRYYTGFPAFTVFAYQYAGLDSLGDPLISLSDKSVTKRRNAALAGDIEYMGTYQPVWSGGFTNIIRYKGFGLSINAIYNLGHVMRRDVNLFSTGRLTHNSNYLFQGSNLGFSSANVHSEFANRWRSPGDERFTLIPSYISNTSLSDTRRDVEYYRKGNINVISASYIKLRDITFSYSLSNSFNRRIKTDNITFRVQLSNIMLWKANRYGIDPEFQEAFSGTRNLKLNQATISAGAHITF